MMTYMPMITDLLVIIMLAGTIFYAVRLSVHIKAFQKSKQDMEGLLLDLSDHIEQATQAIDGLRENARLSGRDIQEKINDARAITEDLQIMTDAGERLASRLDVLSGKIKSTTPIPKTAREDLSADDASFSATQRERRPRNSRRTRVLEREEVSPDLPESLRRSIEEPMANFAIRDPEFEEPSMDMNGLMPEEYDDDFDTAEEEFSSQAEKDLYEALKYKKSGARGVS